MSRSVENLVLNNDFSAKLRTVAVPEKELVRSGRPFADIQLLLLLVIAPRYFGGHCSFRIIAPKYLFSRCALQSCREFDGSKTRGGIRHTDQLGQCWRLKYRLEHPAHILRKSRTARLKASIRTHHLAPRYWG